MKSCLFHEGVPAVVHCFQCHKPLCKACVKAQDGGKFCSASCAAANADLKAKFGGAKAKRAASALAGYVGLLVRIAVAVAIGLAALHAAVRWGHIDALKPYDRVGRWIH